MLLQLHLVILEFYYISTFFTTLQSKTHLLADDYQKKIQILSISEEFTISTVSN